MANSPQPRSTVCSARNTWSVRSLPKPSGPGGRRLGGVGANEQSIERPRLDKSTMVTSCFALGPTPETRSVYALPRQLASEGCLEPEKEPQLPDRSQGPRGQAFSRGHAPRYSGRTRASRRRVGDKHLAGSPGEHGIEVIDPQELIGHDETRSARPDRPAWWQSSCDRAGFDRGFRHLRRHARIHSCRSRSRSRSRRPGRCRPAQGPLR